MQAGHIAAVVDAGVAEAGVARIEAAGRKLVGIVVLEEAAAGPWLEPGRRSPWKGNVKQKSYKLYFPSSLKYLAFGVFAPTL